MHWPMKSNLNHVKWLYFDFEATDAVAELASMWNIPVFSWYSSDGKFSNKDYYNTLVRTYGSMDKTGEYNCRLSHQEMLTKFQRGSSKATTLLYIDPIASRSR